MNDMSAVSRSLNLTLCRRLQPALVGLGLMALMMPAQCWAGSRTCLTGTAPQVANDASQIRAIRQSVHDTCACSSFDGSSGKTRLDYLYCTISTIINQLILGNVRPQCTSVLLNSVVESTCGFDPNLHAAPCIREGQNGAISCAVVPMTTSDGITPSGRCSNGTTFTKQACAGFTNCLDAADTNNNLMIGPGDTGMCQATACVRGRALSQGLPMAAGTPVYIFSTNPAPSCPGTPDSWGTLSSQGSTAADNSGNFCVDFPLAPLNHPADPTRADRWVLPADCTSRFDAVPGSGVASVSRSLTDTNNASCETNPNDCEDVGDVNIEVFCGGYGC